MSELENETMHAHEKQIKLGHEKEMIPEQEDLTISRDKDINIDVDEKLFINKLGKIPLVNDGWSAASEYYALIKDYNAVTNMACSMAETGVKVAGQISSPVFIHYQPQITTINDYACKKLDELENKYPVINQPTDELKKACSEMVKPVVGQVKPVISQVQGIVSSSKQKLVNIHALGTNMVEEAKNRGVSTASHVVNSTFETTPGRFVTRTVESALGMADNLVDKYLPEEETERVIDLNNSLDGCESDSTNSDSFEGNIEEMQEMDPTPKRVIIHAGSVTEKIRKRMFRRAIKDFSYAKARATSALNQMQKSVNLIGLSKGNLGAAKGRVEELWVEISKEQDPSTEEKSVLAGTIEDRIVALGRLSLRQVRSNVATLEKVYAELGEFGKNPISKSKEYKQLIETFFSVESVQKLSSQGLAQINSSLKFVQTTIQTMVDNVKTMDWAAMDIEMEDIELNENDLGMEQVISNNNNSEHEVERENRT